MTGKKDFDVTKKLLQTIECQNYQIKGMFRLGQFDSEDRGKCRPIQICFYKKPDKKSLMRNIYKLNDTSDVEIKNLKVDYDLSKPERDAVREKIEEAKIKSTLEVFMAVRGPSWALRLVPCNIIQ